MNKVIIAHKDDNVGTTTRTLSKQDALVIKGMEMTILSDVPAFHKISFAAIEKGQAIIKYGEVIGTATEFIEAGSHVHVHNIESNRGRGDRKEGSNHDQGL